MLSKLIKYLIICSERDILCHKTYYIWLRLIFYSKFIIFKGGCLWERNGMKLRKKRTYITRFT